MFIRRKNYTGVTGSKLILGTSLIVLVCVPSGLGGLNCPQGQTAVNGVCGIWRNCGHHPHCTKKILGVFSICGDCTAIASEWPCQCGYTGSSE